MLRTCARELINSPIISKSNGMEPLFVFIGAAVERALLFSEIENGALQQ